ncbi:MAG: SGNH/GDSL hydrolase family protein [Verrucomicrobiae bacterium]|nr:SGNH/GDSL hydrolase family protein [Verrucomicrobiae bacterium]
MNLENSLLSRRDALVAGLTGSAAAALSFSPSTSRAEAPKLAKGNVILFQGDSITDAGRDRKTQDQANDSAMLGRGYPHFIADGLLADHADLDLKIYNRGISGNKVPDLDARWQKDCLDLKPNILSILIGVNDIWHKLNGRYDGTPEIYRDGFTALLDRTKKALPDVTLVICEPFVLKTGAVNDTWFPEFETRRAFAEEVAKKANAIWVPFQKMFNDAVASGTEPAHWAKDGVHPTADGHQLMAKTWRETVGI